MKYLLRVLIVLFFGFCFLPQQPITLSAATPSAPATKNGTNLAPITPENAQQLKSIKRFGMGMVRQLQWSADGKLLAICSSAGIWLYLTDKLDGEPRLLQDSAECRKLAISADGLTLASFGNIDDAKVQVWDMATGVLKIELQWQDDQPGWPYSIAFSPDSSLLAFGGLSGVQIWDFKTQTQRNFSTDPYGHPAVTLTFNTSGTLLATAGPYGIDIWDVKTGERTELQGASLEDIKFSADGKYLVATNGNNARLWNVANREQRAVLFNNDYVYSAQFSADGKRVITGNANSIIEWDAFRYVKLSNIQNPFAPVKNVVLNSDGSLAAAIDDRDVRVFVWETKTGKLRAELTAFTREMRAAKFDSTGRGLVFSGNNGVWLWDRQSDHLVTLLVDSHRNYLTAGFLDEDRKIYVTDRTPDFIMWDAQSRQEISTGEIGPYGDRKAISPNGKTLAIGRPNASIVLVDIQTGQIQRTLKGHTEMIRYLVFSSDGKLLASCANDSSLRVWDTTTGTEQVKIVDSEHLFLADVIAFNPGSTEIASSTGGLGSINFWNTKTGKRIRSVSQPTANRLRPGIASLVYNATGTLLASSGFDGVVYIWDTQTRTVIARLPGHLDAIYSLDFSPDGKLLASASEDGTVRVWGIPQ
jgi:WD40 repeat protein